ncbi:MAG: hypothetical protein ACYTBJ_26000, partial [Planctomycetota bacterium]
MTTADSLLRFDSGNRPLVFTYDDASDDEANWQLGLLTPDDMDRRHLMDRDENNIEPAFFSLSLASDGDGYIMTIYP